MADIREKSLRIRALAGEFLEDEHLAKFCMQVASVNWNAGTVQIPMIGWGMFELQEDGRVRIDRWLEKLP